MISGSDQASHRCSFIRQHIRHSGFGIPLFSRESLISWIRSFPARYLPIYVSSPQGEFIRSLLVDNEITEPVDFDFSVPDVDINIAELQSVIINRLKDNVFYAKLLFTHQNKSIVCPPAKDIALSLRVQVPIFVEETVLRKAMVEIQA